MRLSRTGFSYTDPLKPRSLIDRYERLMCDGTPVLLAGDQPALADDPAAMGRADASMAAPDSVMRARPAPTAILMPSAVPAVPTMMRAWSGIPHRAAPTGSPTMVTHPMMPARPPRRWRRPDLCRGGGEGRAEKRQQPYDYGLQQLHHA